MKRCKRYVCVLLLVVMTLMLSGQTMDKEWSDQFTQDMREYTGDRDIDCMVHVDVRGSIDFWVTKSGEFDLTVFATAIGWVAGFALGAGDSYSDLLDTLYFKRSVDRFSMAEISAKECLLIYALMQRGQLNDEELEEVINRTIKWTRVK